MIESESKSARPRSRILLGGMLCLAVGGWIASGCKQLASTTTANPTDEILGAEAIGLLADPIAGPFDEVTVYCKKRRARCRSTDEAIDDDELEPPYEGVEIVRLKRKGVTYCELAIAIEQGWYMTKELFLCDSDVEITNLEMVAQKDTAPIVRLEIRTEDESDGATMLSEEVVYCGVGASGDVSCTEPFSRLEHVQHRDGQEEHRAVSMTLSRFGVLKVNGEARVDGEVQDIGGAYRLEFP